MEIPLRFRQIALLPTALVLILLSFPVAVAVRGILLQIADSFTDGIALVIFGWLSTFGALGFWCVMIWLIYKFVSTGGLGALD
jgi:hypothetical protein